MLQCLYLCSFPFIRRMNYAFVLAFKWQIIMYGHPFSWAHIHSPSLTVKTLTLGWNKRPFSNLCIFKPASHQPRVHINNRVAVWLPGRERVFILFIFYPRLCLPSFEKAVYLLRKDTWPRSLDGEVALTAFLSYFSMQHERGALCWDVCLQEVS